MTVWLIAAAAGAASLWLGRLGLKRLQRGADLPVAASWTAAAACAAIGMCLSWPEHHAGNSAFVLTSASAFLCALLATAALADWKTSWAPTELMLPICLLAGACAAATAGPYESSLGFSAAAGGTLFAAAWGLWTIQIAAGWPILPPADAVSLALPWISLTETASMAAFYLALSTTLMLIRLSERRRNVRSLFPDGEVPLLALAFPALLACMWAEAMLIQPAAGQ